MPTQYRLRPTVLRLSAALSLGLVALSFAWQVPAVKAAGAADSQAGETVRLINGARAAAGKPALLVDTFLAAEARDGAIPCPDNAAQAIAGRALDFATYGNMSHSVRLCNAAAYTLSGTTFVSLLQSKWGYGSVGEILLVNGGYGNGQYLYTSGAWSTWTYATTGHAMTAWSTSSSHWNIVMGAYDRVGCGAWSSSGSTIYYACEFSSGGSSPNGLKAAPTQSPFSGPLPTPAPIVAPAPTPAPVRVAVPVATRAAPVAPVASVAVPNPVIGTPDVAQTQAAAVNVANATPPVLPTAVVQGVRADASPVAAGVAAVVDGGAGDLSAASGTTIPPGLTHDSVVGFTAGAVILVGFWVLIDRIRRRRRVRMLD